MTSRELSREDQLKKDIAAEALRIHRLRNHIQYADVDQQEVLLAKLHGTEQAYFTLFNQLRVLLGTKPLEGHKFTGDHRYESYLFQAGA